MKVITNYKGKKIIGDSVKEVINTVKRLQDKEKQLKQNHVIFW